MGAWGVSAFDNDDANDWAYGLDKVDDLSLVRSALEIVVEADDYLEAPDACSALAACEVLARLKGQFGYQNAYTEKVDDWVRKHPIQPPSQLISVAESAIDRILADNSELFELWTEGDASEWLESVQDLRNRLTAR